MYFGKEYPKKWYLIEENGTQEDSRVNRASWMLGRLRKTCKNVYPTFERTHLELASSGFRGTGMVLELRSMEYEEGLKKLGYTDLGIRRKRDQSNVLNGSYARALDLKDTPGCLFYRGPKKA
ncbi:hypothetical protein BpHYR1_039705 [Brachionus plicatilis]|uniref:Uncharacterized protein n=1 Tax=Brachionus plicatilis TaxID=10195 RepID=A0A3M7PXV1_BRAPC|nr:hypothetical protein BpHYR1_039705 [Brachionus plicatilis]